jgi:TonB-dependent starch-binding outer membrane protein SusC
MIQHLKFYTKQYYFICRAVLLFLVIFLIMSTANILFAQEVVFRGKITDRNGKPLPGTTIQQKGTNFATFSANDGTFRFTAKQIQPILIFSKPGFETIEKSVNGSEFIEVILPQLEGSSGQTKRNNLNMGYYLWKENNISSSVSAINISDISFSGSQLTTILDQLPGVNVRTQSGQPGSFFTTSVRGTESVLSNEPLFVVDGIILNAGINMQASLSSIDPLSYLNPNDIKNVTILKDASAAAIYGSQGANGVILVETKSGDNKPFQVNFRGQSGVQFPIKKTNYLNAGQYIDLLNESLLAADMGEISFINPTENVQWSDELLNTGITNDYGISVSGAGDKSKFYISGNLNHNIGVLGHSNFNNGGILFKGQNSITTWLNLKASVNYARAKQSSTINSLNQLHSNPYVIAQSYPPLNNETIANTPLLSQYYGNNNAVELIEQNDQENTGNRYTANFEISAKISQDLTFVTAITGDYSENFQSSIVYYPVNQDSYLQQNILQNRSGDSYNWYINNFLKLQKQTGNHNFIILGGVSENFNKITEYYFYEGFENLFPAEGNSLSFSGNNSRRVNAFFIQSNYVFDNKFDVLTSFRREKILRQTGTDLFGLFPSFSAGYWLLKNENNVSNQIISGIKLKAGWGISGAESFNSLFYSFADASSGHPLLNFFMPNNSYVETFQENARWEISEEWNIGWLTYLLNDDLMLEFNYFDRLRSNVALPQYNNPNENYQAYLLNTGRVNNSGWEFRLNYLKSIGDLNMFFSFDIQSSQNRFLGTNDSFQGDILYNAFGATSSTPISILAAGEEIGAFVGFVYDGIFQSVEEVGLANSMNGDPNVWYQDEGTSPGDIRFKDIDQNGIIDENDLTVLGGPNPDFTYGLNLRMTYKNYDFAMVFDGSHGNEIYNLNKLWGNATGGAGNRTVDMLSRWNLNNASEILPRVHFEDLNLNNRPHSEMIEDGNYLRLNSIDFGYTFSKKNKNKKIRIYISAKNIVAFSSYSGDYPVVGYQKGYTNLTGIDYGWYPSATTLLVGIQIDL